MFRAITRFFEQHLIPSESDEPERPIQYATAALLLEMSKADFEQDELERSLIIAMLRDTFELDKSALDELIALAESATTEANDVFQFTQLVNDHYSYEEKTRLVTNLWQVAYADGRLDKYEEQFIRKVSGLLHLAHSDFIKAKLTAREKMED